MNDAPTNSPALGLAGSQPQDPGWSRAKWLAIVALIFAAHVAFIFAFGEKKEVVPRAVANVPVLKFADNADELLALNDPTLFALPHQQDFASAIWLKKPGVKPPSFRWTEPPRALPLSAENLGAAFQQFMRTNSFASYPLDFKPQPKLSEPIAPIEPALAQNSTLQIAGELAQRRLLDPISLPSLPYNDVIAPSVVQVLVDATGNVASVVLLESSGLDAADQRALELARAARFASSPRLTFGKLIFNWHTVPPTATNAPAISP